ncbi:MAG TPA: ATP-binding protein [Polyangia bacterium]
MGALKHGGGRAGSPVVDDPTLGIGDFYEASFNSAAVGIAHIATDGRWLRANPRFCQLVGYPADELARLRVRDLAHPADMTEDLAGLKRLAAGEIETLRREERYVRKDGRAVWVESTISPLRDRAGKLRHFVAVVDDITGYRDAEKRERLLADVSQLLLECEDHQTDLERVGQLIVASLGDGCVIGVTSDHDELIGAPVVVLADRGRANEAVALSALLATSADYLRSLGDERSLTSVEPAVELGRIWGVGEDAIIPLGARAALSLPLSARGRTFGQVMFLAADAFGAGEVKAAYEVTRRIALAIDNGRLYQKTQDAVRDRDEFLAIALHELRTPLTPLRIHLQRLLAADGGQVAGDPNRLQGVLHRCERKVRRLEALVDNLFDVSHITEGRLNLQLDDLELTTLVRDVAARFRDEATAAACDLVVTASGPVMGRWDRLRLEQVVGNVVENALRHGPGKPVELELQATDQHARLSIRDHGVGIAADDLGGIFERFHRIVSSPHHSGLQLGLFIARQIVDAHQGTIVVDSEPGAGARFTIELPLHLKQAKPVAVGAVVIDGRSGDGGGERPSWAGGRNIQHRAKAKAIT